MTTMDETVILVHILSGNFLAKIILHRMISIVRCTMPARRKGASFGRQILRAASMRNKRAQRTEGRIQQDNTDASVRMAQLYQAESEDARPERNEQRRLEQRQACCFIVSRYRANDQKHQQVHRAFTANSLLHLPFEYEHDIQ